MQQRLNRMALENADIVFGTLNELKQLRLDPASYLSCGDPAPGVERCPFADECTFAFKGNEGMERVIDIDEKTLKVLTTTNDKGEAVPVTRMHPAGGAKNLAIYRKDGWTEKARIMVLPCYRYMSNRKRWSKQDAEGRHDLVAILAREGDGKMIPMSETKETIEGTNRDGRPKFAVRRIKEYRAVPFHPRPAELLPERAIDLEVEDMLRRRAIEDSAVVVAGLAPEDRPIDLSAGLVEGALHEKPQEKPDARQAARRAQGAS